MKLPFTKEQFLDLFASYNTAIWPLQIILNLAAVGVVVMAFRRFNNSDRLISIVLGLLWLWMGVVYHMIFFTSINPAAYVFGALYIVQALLLFWTGYRNQTAYRPTFGLRDSVGGIFILYALLVYPALGMALGHVYPHSPSFGAPCPTTIFTFGVFLWAPKLPRYLLVIPFLWSLVGFTAALTMGIREDIGLLVAGVVGTGLVLLSHGEGVGRRERSS